MQGVGYPSYAMISLDNLKQQLTVQICFLPNQLRMYILYMFSFLGTVLWISLSQYREMKSFSGRQVSNNHRKSKYSSNSFNSTEGKYRDADLDLEKASIHEEYSNDKPMNTKKSTSCSILMPAILKRVTIVMLIVLPFYRILLFVYL